MMPVCCFDATFTMQSARFRCYAATPPRYFIAMMMLLRMPPLEADAVYRRARFMLMSFIRCASYAFRAIFAATVPARLQMSCLPRELPARALSRALSAVIAPPVRRCFARCYVTRAQMRATRCARCRRFDAAAA